MKTNCPISGSFSRVKTELDFALLMFLYNQDGDLGNAILRHGNKASAKSWQNVLLPVIKRYRHLSIPKFFRGNAGSSIQHCIVCWRKKVKFHTPLLTSRSLQKLLTCQMKVHGVALMMFLLQNSLLVV